MKLKKEMIYLRVVVKIQYDQDDKNSRVDAIREAKRCCTAISTLGIVSVEPKTATLIKKQITKKS